MKLKQDRVEPHWGGDQRAGPDTRVAGSGMVVIVYSMLCEQSPRESFMRGGFYSLRSRIEYGLSEDGGIIVGPGRAFSLRDSGKMLYPRVNGGGFVRDGRRDRQERK